MISTKHNSLNLKFTCNVSRLYLILICALFQQGCTGMSYYKEQELIFSELRQNEDGTNTLLYKTMDETLFFSPGVEIKEKSSPKRISIVRCKINSKCVVKFKSKWIGGQYEAILPAGKYIVE
jgi:hypothetical protein